MEHLAFTEGLNLKLVKSVIQISNRQRLLPLQALRQRFGADFSSLTVGVFRLAFKPGTDDVRETASLHLIEALVDEGGHGEGLRPSG